MYKPKPMTDADIDKYLADLEATEFENVTVARNVYYRPYKVPVPRLGKLWAITGGVLLSGSLLTLIWILYGIYTKVHGGIR